MKFQRLIKRLIDNLADYFTQLAALRLNAFSL